MTLSSGIHFDIPFDEYRAAPRVGSAPRCGAPEDEAAWTRFQAEAGARTVPGAA